MHKWSGLPDKSLIAESPNSKLSKLLEIINSGSSDRGLVSMQLIKIDLGSESIFGILLNGLVLKDVQSPDSIKFSLIEDLVWLAKSSVLIDEKDISSS